jgi:UDP:flavonoid glycosyltransferase YjiC (YdhE family)
VLVAPLDWGLGHATRCIPVIQQLLARGCTVIIAAEGAQLQLLREEFPTNTTAIEFVNLKGYEVKYTRSFLLLRLLAQLPAIQKAIRYEHDWLRRFLANNRIDWVISDNRYGLWSKQAPCTFMTHQLRVRVPGWLKSGEALVQKMLYRHINSYTACWVPDLADENRGLSGKLGHPVKKPTIPLWYVGWLSRFTAAEEKQDFQYKCLVALSGPEPQRSLLENKILEQLKQTDAPVLLLRGLPGNTDLPKLPAHITAFNHLPAAKLQEAMLASEYLVSRCGYSTLMDAFTLQKKCIFIPTPGQTEQEYLGKRLMGNKMALVYPQNRFNLHEALAQAASFHFHFPLNSMNDLLEMAIDHFLKQHFAEREV